MMNETNGEYLLITNTIFGKKCILEKLPSLSSSLCYIQISVAEIHYLVDKKSTKFNDFMVWNDRLGHPSSIMIGQTIKNFHGHSLKN